MESSARRFDSPPNPAPAAKPHPLGGVRVLDLSRFIAGPFAGRLLGARLCPAWMHSADDVHPAIAPPMQE